MILASVEPLAQGLIASQTRQRNETVWTLKACTAEQMAGLCRALKGQGAFLLALFAEDEGDERFVVHIVFSLAPEDAFLTLKLPVDPDTLRFPSITATYFGANWMEREVQDLFGLVAEGHPNPRRWVSHGNWPQGVYPLRKTFSFRQDVPWEEGDFYLRTVEGEGVFELPVGPVHAGVIEPGHFRFSVAGEPIVNLQTRLFFAHKGTEKRAEGLPLERVLFLAERLSGDTTVAHTLAFCHAVERLCEATVPPRAQALRLVLLELERMYNHVSDVAALANDTAFAIGSARGMTLRERLVAFHERWTGNRLLMGTLCLGGVRFELDDARRQALAAVVRQVADELNTLWQLLSNSASVMDRFEGTGYLDPEHARELGVVGVVGRASGIARDARRDHPWGAYVGVELDVPVYQAGDVGSRARVRVDEIERSKKLILQTLEQLPSGPLQVELPAIPARACALGYVEGWRGEVYHWLKTDDRGRVARYRVTDPSVHNWPALLFAVQGNTLADFPLINKSFNLSYSGNDR